MELPSKKKVLITGVSGFTGRHLEKELLSKGYQVFGTVFSNSDNPNHSVCNILNRNELSAFFDAIGPDYVIHLAGVSFTAEADIAKIYETNVIGTINVLEACKKLPVLPRKVLLASSASVYGNVGSKLHEEMCPQPINHYGNSKLAMEHMAKTYFNDLDIIITRPFNYTGPGQEDHFLIPKIVAHFRNNKQQIELGNLNTFREYNDVNWLCAIYADLIKSNVRSEVINVSSGKTYSLQQVLEIMAQISGYKIQVQVNPKFVRKNEIVELKGETSKLERLMGKKVNPQPLEMTLKQML